MTATEMSSPLAAPVDDTTTLSHRYRQVRDLTEALAAPLSPEDQCVQSMPDASPTKWHRAHVTWFFETFVLRPNLAGYEPVNGEYEYLFNSYYEAVGERQPRAQRGLITRPNNTAVTDYRRRVDEAMLEFIDSVVAHRPELRELIELGLQHEQQHQELLLMDIKHALSQNRIDSAYVDLPGLPSGEFGEQGWIVHPGGLVEVGHDGQGFHFDNEGPRHQTMVQPHRLADRLVTAGEWLEFMGAGGYDDHSHWLSDGWFAVQRRSWNAPLYWFRSDDQWMMHTLHGPRPVDPAEPVVHVSYYEADAFARWAGARLPTEFEWEAHASALPVVGNQLSSRALHPTAATGHGLRQMFGDVWEWTASAYAPYPRFAAPAGAVGEYNGKFMIDQQVLRGGACVTPDGHIRSTYRNFFPTGARWMFSGVRLADDGGRS